MRRRGLLTAAFTAAMTLSYPTALAQFCDDICQPATPCDTQCHISGPEVMTCRQYLGGGPCYEEPLPCPRYYEASRQTSEVLLYRGFAYCPEGGAGPFCFTRYTVLRTFRDFCGQFPDYSECTSHQRYYESCNGGTPDFCDPRYFDPAPVCQ